MKVIKVGCCCEHCENEALCAIASKPRCSQCITAGVECKPNAAQVRIAQACDRCRSKKIRCDGVRPASSQCVNVGFECKPSDKLLRRAFPRGYTESLEERVRCLETDVRELKDLLDEKDEKIDVLARIAASKENNHFSNEEDDKSKQFSKFAPEEPLRLARNTLNIITFEIEKNGGDEKLLPPTKQSKNKTEISQWIQDSIVLATSIDASPAVYLLNVDTPDDPTDEDFKILPPRRLYEEVQDVTKPVLEVLSIPKYVLGTFGSVIFDIFTIDLAHKQLTDTEPSNAFAYHIALGFFSLAFRYFPESKACLGVLLIQNYKGLPRNSLVISTPTKTILVSHSFFPFSLSGL